MQLGETLRTPFTRDIETLDTAIALLHDVGDRRVLVILADGKEALMRVMSAVESGSFRDGLVSDTLGVYSVP